METHGAGSEQIQEELNGKRRAEEEAKATNYAGSDRMVHFLDYHQDHFKQDEKIKTFHTGLTQLDALVEGFQTGEVVVITGPTGNGKTLCADTIGMRLMRHQKQAIAWFSYEVPTLKMIDKYVTAQDKDRLGLFVPYILVAGQFEWIKARCLEAKLKHNISAVIVDHLHFLVDMQTQHNMSLNIGAVMRKFKREIAVDMNLLVFILAHQGQKKEGEPSLENIRDSSFIAQEADMVFVVYREPDPLPSVLKANADIKGYERSYTEGRAFVKIEKARRSGVYRRKIAYQKQGHWLEEAFL